MIVIDHKGSNTVTSNQFVCLRGRVLSSDSSGSYTAYFGPTFAKFTVECLNGGRRESVPYKYHASGKAVFTPLNHGRTTIQGSLAAAGSISSPEDPLRQ